MPTSPYIEIFYPDGRMSDMVIKFVREKVDTYQDEGSDF
jgi:hypothetical protein